LADAALQTLTSGGGTADALCLEVVAGSELAAQTARPATGRPQAAPRGDFNAAFEKTLLAGGGPVERRVEAHLATLDALLAEALAEQL
jgi:hypothetical protein